MMTGKSKEVPVAEYPFDRFVFSAPEARKVTKITIHMQKEKIAWRTHGSEEIVVEIWGSPDSGVEVERSSDKKEVIISPERHYITHDVNIVVLTPEDFRHSSEHTYTLIR